MMNFSPRRRFWGRLYSHADLRRATVPAKWRSVNYRFTAFWTWMLHRSQGIAGERMEATKTEGSHAGCPGKIWQG
jgi:hypothetical protein